MTEPKHGKKLITIGATVVLALGVGSLVSSITGKAGGEEAQGCAGEVDQEAMYAEDDSLSVGSSALTNTSYEDANYQGTCDGSDALLDVSKGNCANRSTQNLACVVPNVAECGAIAQQLADQGAAHFSYYAAEQHCTVFTAAACEVKYPTTTAYKLHNLIGAAANLTITVEAESYTRAGPGVGCYDFSIQAADCDSAPGIVGSTQSTAWMEYDLNVEGAGTYDISFRYAAGTSRPMDLGITHGGEITSYPGMMAGVTTGWGEADQETRSEDVTLQFAEGLNTLRIETAAIGGHNMPSFDKIIIAQTSSVWVVQPPDRYGSHQPAILVAATEPGVSMCLNTCSGQAPNYGAPMTGHINDGKCDDNATADSSDYRLMRKFPCALGTDCADCGPRQVEKSYADSAIYEGYPGVPPRYEVICARCEARGPEWWLGDNAIKAKDCALLCARSNQGDAHSRPCKYFLHGYRGDRQGKCYHESTWHASRRGHRDYFWEYDLYELCHPAGYGWSRCLRD